jgi:hypothetical protein
MVKMAIEMKSELKAEFAKTLQNFSKDKDIEI